MRRFSVIKDIIMRATWIMSIVIISLMVISCGAPEEGEDSIDSVIGNQAEETDGTALYAQYCEVCHKSLSETTEAKRTDTEIQQAILDDVGEMGLLIGLVESKKVPGEKLTAIANILQNVNFQGGAYFYAQSCVNSGCHTDLGTATFTDKTATGIKAAITANKGGMGTLSLSDDQISSVSDAVQGADLYTNNYCSSCHGQFISTQKPSRNADKIQKALETDANMVKFYQERGITFTSAQVKQIAVALGGEKL
ncbi:MAG: hypothetical protein HQM11_15355 [SAR324 cluster bacterium]|nr:hypothetical protein [SAR324 cluster bacterium]